MLLSFVLSLLSRQPSYDWRPALDLSDPGVVSTLLPGTQY